MSIPETVHTVRLVEREGAVGRLRDAVMKVDRENPTPQDIANLRAVLRADPILGRVLFDLSQVNTDRLIESLAPDSVLVREAISVTVETMRDDLGYRQAPEMERLLIEHVALCWLRVQKVEGGYTAFLTQREVVIAQADWWERKLTAAHARYVRAVESLARVRRMARPSAVQINVGDQQVNVAGRVVVE